MGERLARQWLGGSKDGRAVGPTIFGEASGGFFGGEAGEGMGLEFGDELGDGEAMRWAT